MENKNQIREEFFQIISNAREFLISYKPQFILKAQTEINKLHTIKRLIFSHLVEILDILELWGKDRDNFSFTENLLEELQKNKKSGIIPNEHISYKENELQDKQFELVTRMVLEEKAVFEWLYTLKELLERLEKLKSSKEKKHLISEETWNKLLAFCDYRHIFLTHKHELQNYYGEGMEISSKWGDIDLRLLTPVENLSVKEIDKLFAEAEKYLDLKRQTINYILPKYRALTKNLFKFPQKLRKKIKPLLQKYGGSFPPIIEVARFINTLIFELIPRLSEL